MAVNCSFNIKASKTEGEEEVKATESMSVLREDLEKQHQEKINQVTKELKEAAEKREAKRKAELEKHHDEKVVQLIKKVEAAEKREAEMKTELKKQHEEKVEQLVKQVEAAEKRKVEMKTELKKQHEEKVNQLAKKVEAAEKKEVELEQKYKEEIEQLVRQVEEAEKERKMKAELDLKLEKEIRSNKPPTARRKVAVQKVQKPTIPTTRRPPTTTPTTTKTATKMANNQNNAVAEAVRVLNERLTFFGFYEKTDIKGDGSCLFAAVSDQYYGSPDFGQEVRLVVYWLLLNKEGKRVLTGSETIRTWNYRMVPK